MRAILILLIPFYYSSALPLFFPIELPMLRRMIANLIHCVGIVEATVDHHKMNGIAVANIVESLLENEMISQR